MSLLEAIRQKIIELGDTGAAQFFGVDVSTTRRWRTGALRPSLEVADRLLAAGLPPTTSPEDRSAEGVCLEANWEGKQVMLCLPWYKSAHPLTTFSILAMLDRARMGVVMVHGDAFISHARNRIAQRFLASDAEWSMWFDDDMIFPNGNAAWFNEATGFAFPPQWAGVHTINRLLAAKKTLVGGLYFGRSPAGLPMYAEACADSSEAAFARRGPQDVVKPARWVATGCLLVHRKVFEDLDRKFPQLHRQFFSPSEHDLVAASEAAGKVLGDRTIPAEQRCADAAKLLVNGQMLARGNSKVGAGEDVIFCIRAAAAGHQAHVDCGVVCGHVGTAVYGPRNTFS